MTETAGVRGLLGRAGGAVGTSNRDWYGAFIVDALWQNHTKAFVVASKKALEVRLCGVLVVFHSSRSH